MKKILFHSFSFHHDKYMKKIHEIISGSIFISQENKSKIENCDFEIGVTNSYLGFNTTDLIKRKSKESKLISLCHTTFGWSENISLSRLNENGFIFAAPEFWKVKEKERVISYRGHYMMLYHYFNKPAIEKIDGVLYLPPSGIKKIEEVMEIIKNIKQKIYIKLHPISELDNFPINWSESAKGLQLKDYKKIESDRIKIITSKEMSLEMAIDAFDFIIGTPPTSALIEAIARGKIYNQNKKVIYTNNMEGIPEKYGIEFSSSPKIKNFGTINESVINQIVIGKEKQVNEIKKLLSMEIENG